MYTHIKICNVCEHIRNSFNIPGFVREIAQRFIDVNAQDSDTELYKLGDIYLNSTCTHRLDLYLSRTFVYIYRFLTYPYTIYV